MVQMNDIVMKDLEMAKDKVKHQRKTIRLDDISFEISLEKL